MKFIYGILILILAVAVSGCVTKSRAQAMARKAYFQGEQAAFASMKTNAHGIVVLGDVQNHHVPWVDGLTLAQAIATATYTGLHDPKEIILNRHGEVARINPRDLFHGGDVPLEPGDIITVNEH